MGKDEIINKTSTIIEKIKGLLNHGLEDKETAKETLCLVQELNELIAIREHLSLPIKKEFKRAEPHIKKASSNDQITDIQPSIETQTTSDEDLGHKDIGHDTLNKKPISNLSSSIGINERFLLINELFKGDSEDFKNAIEKLNNCQNKSAATSLIKSELSGKYGWEDDSEALSILADLIENRFSN